MRRRGYQIISGNSDRHALTFEGRRGVVNGKGEKKKKEPSPPPRDRWQRRAQTVSVRSSASWSIVSPSAALSFGDSMGGSVATMA